MTLINSNTTWKRSSLGTYTQYIILPTSVNECARIKLYCHITNRVNIMETKFVAYGVYGPYQIERKKKPTKLS